jgi:DNA-binding transcriptional regulator YiaG
MAAFDKPDIRHQGAHTLAEAARYLKLPQATLRAWAVGRGYPVADGQNRCRWRG